MLKVRSPHATAAALRRIGVPVPRAAARVLGGIETIIGAAALAVADQRLALAVGLAYTAFAVYVVLARRRDAGAPCGCFGAAEAPLSLRHLAVVATAAAVSLATAASAAAGSVRAAAGTGVEPVAFVLLTTTSTLLVYLLLTAVPAGAPDASPRQELPA